ncbi:RNA methyltransferase, TrmA family, putative [Eimeria necatrix]|uniref:RNA methyltransferase, TrmA family, putative n=1 Tax=Eimeria necatrix TaxID=51315 RepID=U6MK33_9EIME|nr:RNA methyltransferase, TrmA family, putative [Eimeria necatrix]CDJ62824.1 RNA methyltransferase, TrmA family, putative [Eimeria necatrix]
MEALKKPTTSLGLHGRIIGVCGVALAVACEGCKKKPELCWVPSTPYTEPFKGSREAPEICRRPSKVRVSTRGIYGSFNEYCSGRHCLTTLSSRNTRQIRASPRNLQRAHSFRLPATSIDGLWGTTSAAFAVTSFASMASTRAAACPTDTRGPAFTDSPNSSANSSADLSSSEGSSSDGNVRSTTSNKTKRNKSGGSSCSSSFAQGPLNIVSTAEEGDILRGLKVGPLTWKGESRLRLLLQRWAWEVSAQFRRLLPGAKITVRLEELRPRKGKCKMAFLGTDSTAPGQRASPCPHFLEGCGGCHFIHLDLLHQRKAKQQLLQQMLHELHQEQHLRCQQEQHPQWTCPEVIPLVPSSSEIEFASRVDFLLHSVNGKPRLGLPAFDGTVNIVDIQKCLRMRRPMSEVYRQLRKGLLPLMEDQRLRVLDPRCGAGTLSGLTLRLAEDSTAPDGTVLLRLKGHIEDSARPQLVHFAQQLRAHCPSLKAVTFCDVRRLQAPDEVLAGTDALLVTVFGWRYRITGGTREAFASRGEVMEQIFHALKEATGRATGCLWGALGSGGLLEVLLSSSFEKVVVFAPGSRDADEARKNFGLNGISSAEVVECTNSQDVATALAARAGLYRPLRGQNRAQLVQHAVARGTEIGFHRVEGSALEREVTAKDSAGDCRQRAESAATTTATALTPANSAARESLDAASKLEGIGTSEAIKTAASELPDVLLLSPSRRGLNKASTEIRRWVAAAAPRRIVYIAHEQQAFLRDAKALATVGYELAYFKAFDMSPHTTEVLTVSAFCKSHSDSCKHQEAEQTPT